MVEKNTLTRRSFIKRMTTSLFGLFGIGGGTYYYAKHLEPAMIHIQRDSIQSDSIPADFHNVKIVQFGDTHIGFHYDIDQLEHLVKEINAEKPHIVLFSGDLVDNPMQLLHSEFRRIVNVLTKISGPYGKFWIYGNHDHGGYGTETIAKLMEESDFQLLQNESSEIQIGNSKINIAGLDDVILGKPDLNKTFADINLNTFTLLLCHEPDYADHTVQHPIDLQLSGHSHGGQVRIPFYGHLYSPPFARKYVDRQYTIGQYPLQLFITRGVGTTRLPYRFLCKPEFNVYTLQSNQS
ncbi:metallophosphoesterase [Salirhabdus salicampi]|uniref:metallophosphoesterase n=1 Tax=Salirhabdus salicampi TaxID=476102 RepID=UPI0020C49B1D|nr:metallophosphoesterase [Salirhabdus salicampi]MCP8616029.1 metallophosphoesterase [Salirhabdus salicampi]